eukprot:CAMPEP_0113460948 /NCGR_PEP_ID=MMETSP0014_2-20120614/11270_1 /TAXON_ID=2857 /ORGANISM="Nitzschia sp." /LENGTH=228 /DNA_ID=CAMNT_0000352657 /DNA_START=115 /DNA_END=801 /DNA_ORIENTATION=+ /assembly_acc=CAM_ASM_000159
MNNNLDDSPVGGLSNTSLGGKFTPSSNDSSASPGQQRNSRQHAINSQFQLLGEDLQKIRRASSHHNNNPSEARRELMDDAELDLQLATGRGAGSAGAGDGAGVSGLLYPALEDSQQSFDVDLMEDCDRYTQLSSASGGQTEVSRISDSTMASTTDMSTTSLSSSMMMSGDGRISHSSTASAISRGSTTDSRQLTDYLAALQRVQPRASASSYHHYPSDDPASEKLRRR